MRTCGAVRARHPSVMDLSCKLRRTSKNEHGRKLMPIPWGTVSTYLWPGLDWLRHARPAGGCPAPEALCSISFVLALDVQLLLLTAHLPCWGWLVVACINRRHAEAKKQRKGAGACAGGCACTCAAVARRLEGPADSRAGSLVPCLSLTPPQLFGRIGWSPGRSRNSEEGKQKKACLLAGRVVSTCPSPCRRPPALRPRHRAPCPLRRVTGGLGDRRRLGGRVPIGAPRRAAVQDPVAFRYRNGG